MSAEPSMEEILSSIKRIIAEEGEGPIRGRRAPRPVPAPPADEAEVLELNDPLGGPSDDATTDRPREPMPMTAAIPAPVSVPTPAAPNLPAPTATAASAPVEEPAPASPAPASPAPPAKEPPARMADPAPEPILSPRTAEASRTSLDSLSRLLVKPEAGGDGTLEGLVRDMLRPMLRDWLDANLPPMVETMVAAEIARISGQPR